MLAGAKPHICAQRNIKHVPWNPLHHQPCTTNQHAAGCCCLSRQAEQVWVLWSDSHGTDSHAFEAVNVCWACTALQTQQ